MSRLKWPQQQRDTPHVRINKEYFIKPNETKLKSQIKYLQHRVWKSAKSVVYMSEEDNT